MQSRGDFGHGVCCRDGHDVDCQCCCYDGQREMMLLP